MASDFRRYGHVEMISERPEGVRSNITGAINTLTGNPEIRAHKTVRGFVSRRG